MLFLKGKSLILVWSFCASWARIQADQGEENKCGGQEGLQDQDSGGGGAAGGRTRTCRHDGRRGLKSETVGWRTYQICALEQHSWNLNGDQEIFFWDWDS